MGETLNPNIENGAYGMSHNSTERTPPQQEQALTQNSQAEEQQLSKLQRNITEQQSLQEISERANKEILQQKTQHEEIWLPVLENTSFKREEEIYHKIVPEDVIYFEVLEQGRFLKQTEQNYKNLKNQEGVQDIPRWNKDEIEKMFGKGLNPTSLVMINDTSEWFIKNLPLSERLEVMEPGTGAGWATAMLYEKLLKTGKQNIVQYSVDKSPRSIAATQTTLTYRNIPHILVTSKEELKETQGWIRNSEEGKKFTGVILIMDDMIDVFDQFSEKSLSGVYSSHGTAYLSKEQYKTYFNLLEAKLKDNGIFVADSIDPRYTSRPKKSTTLLQVIAPKAMKRKFDKKGIEYIWGEKIPNNSKHFSGDVQVIEGFNRERSDYLYQWCHHLLTTFQAKRLLRVIKSLTTTMKVVDQYRSDVYPSVLLNDIVEQEKLGFSEITDENKPLLPIFLNTNGFKKTS